MKRRPSLPLIAAIALAALVLLFVAAPLAGSSQQACAVCHADYATSLSHSVHRSADCASCHAPGLGARIGMGASVVGSMLPAQLLGRKVSGPVTQTTRASCLSCHSGILSGISSSAKGLVIEHSACATGATCDQCHSTTAHGSVTRWKREPVMEDCIACHNARKAPTKCTSCHVGKSAEQRLQAGPWQVTHGPDWQRTHGMGKLDSCSTCHPRDYCVRCHKVAVPHDDAFGGQHGKLAIADKASCLTCHKTARFCDDCHGIAMPHPSGFLQSHSSVAKTVANPVCQRCHSRDTCDACHVAHIHPGFDGVQVRKRSATTTGTR